MGDVLGTVGGAIGGPVGGLAGGALGGSGVADGSKKGAPPPPDYMGLAGKMGDESRAATATQTQANRPNQSTPWANSKWVQDGNGNWTQSTGFNGPMGAASDSLQKQMAQNYATPMDNGSAVRDQVTNAMYGQATSRLDPQWDKRGAGLQNQLANQGLDMGSEASRGATGDFNLARNDAYSSAMNSAIGMGNQAQDLTFRQNMAARNDPMQQLSGLQSFLSMPGFNAAQQSQGAPWLQAGQALGSYNMQDQQMQNQAASDFWGGLTSLGSTAAMAASDERVKQNITPMGFDAVPGVPVVSFEYRSEPGRRRVGVIAQDVAKVKPDAVLEGPGGVLFVDYSKLRPSHD